MTLSPTLPTKDGTLVASVVWQPQGRPELAVKHHWFVNGIEVVDHSGSELALADFQTGDRVHVVAEVRASDDRVLASERSLSVVIQNRPPTIVSGLDALTQTDKELTGRIVATDPDGEPVTVTLREGPPGLVIQPDGTVHWPLASVKPGQHQLAVEVEDSRGLGYQGTMTFTVGAGA
ncbi:MAG: putative Ig domain-containing protein [Nitrospirota bacterium]